MDFDSKSVFLKTKKKKDSFLEEDNRWDILSPVSLLILCSLSVLFIRSAQAYTGGNQWEMQLLWVVIGLSVYTIVSLIDYHFWKFFWCSR